MVGITNLPRPLGGEAPLRNRRGLKLAFSLYLDPKDYLKDEDIFKAAIDFCFKKVERKLTGYQQ